MSRIPLCPEDRDLNKKVALALGWRDVKALKIQSRNSLLLEGVPPRGGEAVGAGFRARHHVPNFAGDMNGALELLEELRRRGFPAATLARSRDHWECFLEDDRGRRVTQLAAAPARAVCLALLHALQPAPLPAPRGRLSARKAGGPRGSSAPAPSGCSGTA